LGAVSTGNGGGRMKEYENLQKELEALFKDCEFRYKQSGKNKFFRLFRELDYTSWIKGFIEGMKEMERVKKDISKIKTAIEKDKKEMFK
jgi:hypothetical protein